MSTDLSFRLTSVALWQSHDYTTVYDFTRNILYLTYSIVVVTSPIYEAMPMLWLYLCLCLCLCAWPALSMRLCLCYGYTYVYVYTCVPKSVAKAMSLTKTILPMLVKSNTITISIILPLLWLWLHWANDTYPDSKVHVANMGTTWVLSAPVGPHVGPMNLAIRVAAVYHEHNHYSYQIIVRSPQNLSASNHNKTQ